MSGRGAGARAAARARDLLESRGHAATLAATETDAGAEALARRAAESGADRVIAIGGDGTIVEVAAGLLAAASGIPLALVPRGTANVLAVNLGIPRDLAAAVSIAADGEPVAIDVGRTGGEPFLISLGTGLHAELVARASRSLKRRWGVAAYGFAGWRANQEVDPVRYRLTCDGEVREVEATMIQVMNCGAVLRKEWELAPGISPIDGLLDVLAYRASTIPEYLSAAARVVARAPTSTDLVAHRRAARVRIESDPPVRLQRDGEPAGTSPAEITVLPRALPVVMPRDGRWVTDRRERAAAGA